MRRLLNFVFDGTSVARRRSGSPALEVGLDVVEVGAVEAALHSRSSRRYLELVYTELECADSTDDAGRIEASRLAARFAAKEAVMKAIGVDSLPWRSIEVLRSSDGRPSVRLTGAAAASASQRGLRRFALSITHEPSVAAALVVATR